MEIRIGVQQTAREIVLESADALDDISAAVEAAIANGGLLTLEDDKGRRVIIPADRLAYVEISPLSVRRVGFGNS
ncbi:MAG: DUF3107 domain-containing protein [Candidatus Nanopelagicales bacterium]|nr:DUF3107 domain-containing protein [Candidatus Nanopelagicales bacterium]MDP4714801.1 DUF3107 domain-containing protein [Candidatus Nanopelagicales bacterium]MDP4907469.1 DUF3107 domain-containing protein [Candidatus Nanopelagicales bacterium]MDP4975261.1 DUF3107 domain-containing protein [Candidatus Nanopelagicales bacterium]MDP5094921.1 DUF3107 domain-containing protein [Candidatus Nanopelagicales bacterium]